MTLDTARTNDVITRLVEKMRVMVRQEVSRSHVVTRRQGVVTAVATGPPASLSVEIGGSDTVVSGVRYLNSYSPSVGHTVWVDIQDSDPIVIGRLA